MTSEVIMRVLTEPGQSLGFKKKNEFVHTDRSFLLSIVSLFTQRVIPALDLQKVKAMTTLKASW